MRFLPCLAPLPLLAACASATADGPDGGQGFADAMASSDAMSLADAAPPADAALSACAMSLASASFDFESDDQGFTHGQMPDFDDGGVSWTFDHWQRGTPSGGGPAACASGTSCFGTNVAGNYIQCGRAFLASPTIDLGACTGDEVSLSFSHSYDFWSGDFPGGTTWFDGGTVEISGDGGATWLPAPITYPGTIDINPQMTSSYRCVDADNFYADGRGGFVQAGAAWSQVTVAVPAAQRTSQFRVRFIYASGVSSQTGDQVASQANTEPGWYIDDIALSSP